MFLAGLKIILPERLKEEVDHKVLDYKKVIFLVIIGSVLLISWFPNMSILIGIIGVVLGINWLIKNDKYYE